MWGRLTPLHVREAGFCHWMLAIAKRTCGGGAESLGLGRKFLKVFHHAFLAFRWPQLSVQSDLVLAVLADPAAVGWWGPAFREQ